MRKKVTRTRSRITYLQKTTSKKAVASELGVSTYTLNKYHKGISKPSEDNRVKLYNLFRKEGYQELKKFGLTTKQAHDQQGKSDKRVPVVKGIIRAVMHAQDLTQKKAIAKFKKAQITKGIDDAITPEDRALTWSVIIEEVTGYPE